ncbi:MAG: hypothetical protein A2001_10690 [Treponema sp. GWC1_61_84]|nr:MAG: hypothetical protein A2001_10690 [Treponema sp. GWC1_61_84]
MLTTDLEDEGKMRIKIMTAILPLLIILSCVSPADGGDIEAPEEPAFNIQPVWKLDTEYGTTSQPLQDGRYLYIVESNSVYHDEAAWFRIAKVDLESGAFAWRSPVIWDRERTSPAVCGGRVFIQTYAGVMLALSNEDGSLIATIRFASTPEESKMHGADFHLVADESAIFWAHWDADPANPRGLARFDTSLIDYSRNPSDIQTIAVEIVWGGEYSILTRPVIADGAIYVLTYNREYWDRSGYSILAAIDCDTLVERWRRNIPFFQGSFSHPILVSEGSVIIADQSLACYRTQDGTPRYEIPQDESNLLYEVLLGGAYSGAGIFYYNDKLYYTKSSHYKTAEMNGTPEKFNKNILCVDASTGRLLWGDMPPQSPSLGTRPIVAAGKVYVVAYDQLRVYDAETGKLLGVDMTIRNGGNEPNALYNGKLIFFDRDIKARKKTLTAIQVE